MKKDAYTLQIITFSGLNFGKGINKVEENYFVNPPKRHLDRNCNKFLQALNGLIYRRKFIHVKRTYFVRRIYHLAMHRRYETVSAAVLTQEIARYFK